MTPKKKKQDIASSRPRSNEHTVTDKKHPTNYKQRVNQSESRRQIPNSYDYGSGGTEVISRKNTSAKVVKKLKDTTGYLAPYMQIQPTFTQSLKAQNL